MVHQLIYYSRNAVEGGDREMLINLREILAKSQHNNKRDDITGYLIFDKTWFIQILEGDRDVVTKTYNRIASDPRHGGAVIINTRDVKDRLFPNWTMAGALRTPEMQEVYLEHGIGGAIDPTKLSGDKVVRLAVDLHQFEESRRLQRAG
jgi:hypothetical protein